MEKGIALRANSNISLGYYVISNSVDKKMFYLYENIGMNDPHLGW
jgi:hypothetical protein